MNKEKLYKLTDGEISLIHIALDFFYDNYDLYGAEDAKKEVKPLKNKLIHQWYGNIKNK